MLTRTEIMERLKAILEEMDPNAAAKINNVTEDTKLHTELGMSSVSMLYMVIAVEEIFGIEFDTDEQFLTVGQVIDFIEGKLQ